MADEKVRQEEEEWRPAPGHEGRYEVSNLGGVRRSAAGPGTFKGRLLRPRLDTSGYEMVTLYSGSRKGKTCRVHVLVALAFIGEPPGEIGSRQGMWNVNHKDSDRTNNGVSNLEWMTHSRNVKHGYANGAVAKRHRTMRKRGTRYRGSATGAMLTEDQVRAIRTLYASGEHSQGQLAKQFGVTQPNVQAIVSRKTWKHVE